MNTQRVAVALFFGLMATATGAQTPGQQRGQAPQQPAVSPSVWAAPAQPQAQQASSAFQSACGNQPMCYDAPDFAVAVVDFRMSMASGYKLMDATLRFVNKTNQPLILGYLDGSAVALDDQGNRYAPYGNRGLAGIGLVNGASADAKFVLQPGGAGDARWELLWRPGPQDPIGSAFDLSMTIREVNTLVGGQHALGGEIPLRFQGLANGMSGSGVAAGAAPVAGSAGMAGASPMLAGNAAGLPPCGPSGNSANTMNAIAGAANSVGGQQTTNATNTATTTAGNAMSQLAGLKSIFGKKNAAAPATNVAGAANCIPAATSSAMPVAVGTSTAPATAGQVVNTLPAAVPTAAVPGAPAAVTPATVATPATLAPNTPAAAAANAKAAAANAAAARAAGARRGSPTTAAGAAVPGTANAAAPNGTKPGAANAVAPNAKPATNTANPAVVNTAAPNARAVPQPANAAAAKKPATTAPPAPPKKPATTTPPPSK
jgi:hypothetical protein